MSYNSLLAHEYEQTLRDTRCLFPKYAARDLSWWDVARRDPDYCRWIAENVEALTDELREALAWAAEHV